MRLKSDDNNSNNSGYMDSYDFEREKREAIQAGREALKSLSDAKGHLNSASNWGLLDIFGGGFIVNMLKHSKMDDARRSMQRAQYDLRSFSRELRDVSNRVDLSIDISNFLGFADFFFDGFLADMMVQKKINDAKREVDQAIGMVNTNLYDLEKYTY